MDSSNGNTKTVLVESLNQMKKMNYSFIHSLIIFFVVVVCLYNLTIQQTDGQMWEKLLLFSFGLIIPTPKNDKSENGSNAK